EQLDEVLKANNVPDDEINKMTFENAMRWYHWDPFTHIPKDQATVGALRKAAEGHDVSIKALSKKEKTGASFSDFAASAKQVSGNTD
ncbi:amidohydrolase family protein, partial [Mycolicibacterium pulveris]